MAVAISGIELRRRAGSELVRWLFGILVVAALALSGCSSVPSASKTLPPGVDRDALLSQIAACHLLRVIQSEDRAATDAVVIAALEQYAFDVEMMIRRANDLSRAAVAQPGRGAALRRRAHSACEQLAALTGATPGLVRFESDGSVDKTWLVVDGEIGDGFADRVIERLRAERAVGLVINSPGGSLYEARQLGRWLRENGIPVGVDGICTSACVEVLAGGIERYLTASARLGIHQSRVPAHLSTHEGGQLSVVSAALYLREMGIDESVALAAAAVPNNKMYWISLGEALETGLATRIVPGF